MKIIFIILAVVVAVAVSVAFYWYEYRPSQITKQCEYSARITERDNKGVLSYEEAFRGCVRSYGLKYKD